MTAMQSITLADATPTNHVFAPVQSAGGVVTLMNRATAATAAGAETLVLGLSLANAKRKTDRVNVRLNVPHEVTIDSVVQVRDVARANLDVVLPELMTQSERDDFAALCGAAVVHAVTQAYIADRSPLLGS